MATIQTYMDIGLQDNNGLTINKIAVGDPANVFLYLYSDNGPMVNTSVDVYASVQGNAYQAKLGTIITGVNGSGKLSLPTANAVPGTYLYQGVYGGATAGGNTYPPVNSEQVALVISGVPAVNTAIVLYISDSSGTDVATVVQGGVADVDTSVYVAGTAYTFVPNLPLTLEVTLPDGSEQQIAMTSDSTGHALYNLDTSNMAPGAYGFRVLFGGTSGYNTSWSTTVGLTITSGGNNPCTPACINQVQWSCVDGVLTKTTTACNTPTPPLDDNLLIWVGAGALVLVGGALIIGGTMGKKRK